MLPWPATVRTAPRRGPRHPSMPPSASAEGRRGGPRGTPAARGRPLDSAVRERQAPPGAGPAGRRPGRGQAPSTPPSASASAARASRTERPQARVRRALGPLPQRRLNRLAELLHPERALEPRRDPPVAVDREQPGLGLEMERPQLRAQALRDLVVAVDL